jgi:transposase
VLAEAGANVHLAHPLGVNGFAYRRVKNDERDTADLADLLRMGRLPEAWVAPPQVRALREAVRHRCKLVALRSGIKAQVHAVLAKQGVRVPMSDLFGSPGRSCSTSSRSMRPTTPACCPFAGSSTRSPSRWTYWPGVHYWSG